MKKKLLNFITFLILTVSSSQVYADSTFIKYYNKSSNWSTSNIADGVLIITDKVSLNQNVVLPDNIEVSIQDSGEFTNNSYKFSISGDPLNPTNEDPRLIYLRSMNLTPTHYLLLSDN